MGEPPALLFSIGVTSSSAQEEIVSEVLTATIIINNIFFMGIRIIRLIHGFSGAREVCLF